MLDDVPCWVQWVVNAHANRPSRDDFVDHLQTFLHEGAKIIQPGRAGSLDRGM
jgi:hypothetical protein